MRIKSLYLIVYYGFARFLPDSYTPVFGSFFNYIRVLCVKHIFRRCGKSINVNRMAYFGTGSYIEIGDYSSIGANCVIPHNTIIGKYVMMAPEVHIVQNNHEISDIKVPMCQQGPHYSEPTIIEDDVWLGVRSIFTPGHRIGRGSVVAAGAVVTKDVEEYSIVGGNPARLIRKRK